MTTRTACRRRQRRQLLIHDPQARVEFEQNGLRHSLALVDLSPSGLSFSAEAEQMPQFESGTTVRAVEVQVAGCRIRGELVVMHVTQAADANPVCGALFYPETDGDLTKLKALVAGLEAAPAELNEGGGVAMAGEAEEKAAIADGLPKRLDPRTIAVERIQGAIAAAIVAGIALVGTLILVLSVALGTAWTAAVLSSWAIFTVGWFSLALVWPAVRYRHVGYTVSNDGIDIRRGVLWRSVTSVPRNRVQHTDVSTGLIERAFELSTLVIYTAGTQHASVELSGLSQPTARAIRDHLLEGGGVDGV